MPSGSCLCGNLKYEYTGPGGQRVLCHCTECRKMTSSAFSTNIVVSASAYTLQGSPKHYTFVRGDEKHTTSFCGDCGTTVSKTVEGFEKFRDLVIVEAGTLDEGEGLNSMKVDAEQYVKNRAEWVKEIDGAKQVDTA